MTLTKVPFPLLVLAAPLLVGCGARENAVPGGAPAMVHAQIETTVLSSLPETYRAVGTVASRTTSVLSSEVVGRVMAVNVHPGDLVKAGQLLVQISDKDLAAQLAAAQAGLKQAGFALQGVQWMTRSAESAEAAADAQLALARTSFKRTSGLLAAKAATQQQYDEAKEKLDTASADAQSAEQDLQSLRAKGAQASAAVSQARAQVAATQAQLGHCRITSPFAGLVTAKEVDVGDMAVVGAPLLRVEDNAHYRIEVLLGESYLSHVKLGDKVPVTVDGLGGRPITGQVDEIVPSADVQSRSFLIKLALPAAAGLGSGLYGWADFAIGRRQAITVPTQAIVERGQLTAVYVLDGKGIAHLRLIKKGRAYGRRTEVISGLNAGERVVVGDVSHVHEGTLVEPVRV